LNQVVLIGNLTKDPDVRYSTGQNQTAICRFTVAVNDKKKNPQTGQWEDNASFIPVVVFGKQAENCGKYLAKGSKAAVSGRIQTGSYTNKEGQKVYTTDVIANGVEFLMQKNENGSGQNSFTPASPDAFSQPQQQSLDTPPGFESVANDVPWMEG